MSTGTKFFQTVMGRKFYEADVPAIIRALNRIAGALESGTTTTPAPAPDPAATKTAAAVAKATELVNRNLHDAKELERMELLIHGAQYAMRHAIVAKLEESERPEAAAIAQRVPTTRENRQAIWGWKADGSTP